MPAMNVLAFVLGLVAAVNCACPSSWDAYGGSCYRFQTDKENWVAARLMCKMANSDLMTIESAGEQDFFRKKALTFNHTDRNDGFWLGATNWEKLDTWVWAPTNQEIAAYNAWGITQGIQQPNLVWKNNYEHCLAALKDFDYEWADVSCSGLTIQYVCEKQES